MALDVRVVSESGSRVVEVIEDGISYFVSVEKDSEGLLSVGTVYLQSGGNVSVVDLILGGAAVGQVAIAGASSRVLQIAGVATASLSIAGISSQLLSLAGSASGSVVDPAAIIGSSSITLGISGAAAGGVGILGASVQGLVISGPTSGSVGITGVSNTTLAIGGTATGTVVEIGAISGSSVVTLGITGTAVGAVTVAGSSAATLAISGSVAGGVEIAGASTAALSLSGTASGGIAGGGGSTGTLSITGAATGTVVVQGASASTLGITGSAVSNAIISGTSSQSLALAGSASATVPISGLSATTLAFADTAVGRVAVSGASASTLAISGSASGTALQPAAFVNIGTTVLSGSTAVTSQSATLSSVTAGNLILVQIAREVVTQATSVTFGGSSMTLVRSNYDATAGFGMQVYAIIAPTTSASVTATVTYSGSAPFAYIHALQYTGIASATALASACNAAGCNARNTESTTIPVQSITTEAQSFVIAVGMGWNLNQTVTAASGWTTLASGGSVQRFVLDRNSFQNAGTYGGGSIGSWASADFSLTVIMAFPV